MARRIHSRQINGRFRRATLENTLGLAVEICWNCRRFNPHKIGEAKPIKCHACGVRLRHVEDVSKWE